MVEQCPPPTTKKMYLEGLYKREAERGLTQTETRRQRLEKHGLKSSSQGMWARKRLSRRSPQGVRPCQRHALRRRSFKMNAFKCLFAFTGPQLQQVGSLLYHVGSFIGAHGLPSCGTQRPERAGSVAALLMSSFQTSALQNCGRANVCCFIATNLW